LKPVGFICASN